MVTAMLGGERPGRATIAVWLTLARLPVDPASPSVPLWTRPLLGAPVGDDGGDRRDEHRDHAHGDGGPGREEPDHEPREDDQSDAGPHEREVATLPVHVSSVGRLPGEGYRRGERFGSVRDASGSMSLRTRPAPGAFHPLTARGAGAVEPNRLRSITHPRAVPDGVVVEGEDSVKSEVSHLTHMLAIYVWLL